jgi:hypothetical protein
LVLERLVRKLEPAGTYATTIVRDAGRPQLHLAFEDDADARKLAAIVKARATARWVFKLDGAAVSLLAASLPPPRLRPKKPPPDRSPLSGGIRRGPRAPVTRDD